MGTRGREGERGKEVRRENQESMREGDKFGYVKAYL